MAERLWCPDLHEGSADRAHYYFDLRDKDELIIDEEGLELRDAKAVQKEAARLSGICTGQRAKLQRRTKPSNGDRDA